MGFLSSLLLLSAASLPHAWAYSFKFENTPQQCSPLKISLTGSGTPPYRLAIIPSGGSPLSYEARKVMDMAFNDSSSISFILPYPTSSQFVAVVSDNNGAGSAFGSGGATVPVNVVSGGNNSCIPKSQVSPDFIFGSNPVGSLTTCQSGQLNWDPKNITGTVAFVGVIPGGDSFVIPPNQESTTNGQSSIEWTPQIRPGVGVIVVAGDGRGFGTGGSFQVTMQPGNNDVSCINGNSPVSTPGSPAGGSYPTNANGDKTTGGGSSPNIGAIVGGVIGGIAAAAIIGIVLFVLLRRRLHRRREKHRFEEKPVDLLGGREQGTAQGGEQAVPDQYLPEPFHIPNSQTSEGGHTTEPTMLSSEDRRHSGVSFSTQPRVSSEGSRAPGTVTSGTRKSAAGPTSLRPVNIVQHEDAGPSEPVAKEGDDAAETVELPPAYTNLRK